MSNLLYGILVALGIVDLALVTPALRRAESGNVVGRLLATLCTLAGLVIASAGRLLQPPPMNGLTIAGLIAIDVGLLGYALFLPANGLLEQIHRTRRKGRGSAS